MTRTVRVSAMAAAVVAVLTAGPLSQAAAQQREAAPALEAFQEMPDYWAVSGVQAGDVLHLRDVPSADSKSLAGIPANARGLKHLGCRRSQMPFEDWVALSKAARKAALMQWCRVEYNGRQGWVAGRYLKADRSAARR